MIPLTFRPFQAGDETAFRELNEAWISQYFEIEPIVLALLGDRIVGCCALLAMADGGFELGKMSVAEDCRGRGVGKAMLAHVIGRARALGAPRIYLETNTILPNAIHLYESHGFSHLPPERVRRSP